MQHKVRNTMKQQKILTEDARLDIPVLLASALMAVLNFLERNGGESEGIVELSDEVKPILETVLRNH